MHCGGIVVADELHIVHEYSNAQFFSHLGNNTMLCLHQTLTLSLMTCGGPTPRDVGTASDHDHKQFILRTGQTKHAYICVC